MNVPEKTHSFFIITLFFWIDAIYDVADKRVELICKNASMTKVKQFQFSYKGFAHHGAAEKAG
jgi:hypothetical protein